MDPSRVSADQGVCGNFGERRQDAVVDRDQRIRFDRDHTQTSRCVAEVAEMVQILSLTLFEKTPILQVFQEAKMTNQQFDNANPLAFLDF